MSVTTRIADLSSVADQEAYLRLLDAYSSDPMGQGKPLEVDVKQRMIPSLQEHPTTLVVFAYNDETPVGFATCFFGFSTFKAKQLINIHDLAVLSECRGNGVGKTLLAAVEQIARERDCCRVTLEVDERNERAMRAYQAYGFEGIDRVSGSGSAFFMKKEL